MINMSSIIDGFRVILGSVPVHLAMLIAMVLVIRIPDGHGDEQHEQLHHTAFMLYL